MKSAKTIGLLSLADSRVLMSSTEVLTAPNVIYFDWFYYLPIKAHENGLWQTRLFKSKYYALGFVADRVQPLLDDHDDDDCFFQHVIENKLFGTYGKKRDNIWSMGLELVKLNKILMVSIVYMVIV